MKDLYEKPHLDLLLFSTQDIITVSGDEIDNELPDEENPF